MEPAIIHNEYIAFFFQTALMWPSVRTLPFRFVYSCAARQLRQRCQPPNRCCLVVFVLFQKSEIKVFDASFCSAFTIFLFCPHSFIRHTCLSLSFFFELLHMPPQKALFFFFVLSDFHTPPPHTNPPVFLSPV